MLMLPKWAHFHLKKTMLFSGPEFEDVDEKLQESFDELLAEAVTCTM